jgi:hypothetical protein
MNPSLPASPTTSKFLRFVAILQLLTTFVALVPEKLLADFHACVRFGPLPHLPLFLYIVRGAAYCQGAIGVLLWIIAGDVVRYRPLVIAAGWIYLLAGPAFYVIHVQSAMPMWWMIMDTVSCLFFGAAVLFSARGSETAGKVGQPTM